MIVSMKRRNDELQFAAIEDGEMFLFDNDGSTYVAIKVSVDSWLWSRCDNHSRLFQFHNSGEDFHDDARRRNLRLVKSIEVEV